jgi:Ribbon-helix-helix protein, copG family
MSRRTQVTLSDAEYRLLKRESERTGASMSELVRRAVSATYGSTKRRRGNGFEASFGIWKDRDFDGAEYVERIRGPGLGHRLERLGR